MFEAPEISASNPTDPPAPGAPLPVTTLVDEVDTLTTTARSLILDLTRLSPNTTNDAELVDLLDSIEEAKSALSGLESHATLALEDIRRAERGLEDTEEDPATIRSVGTEVAFARHEAPTEGRRHVVCSRILIKDMPLTMAFLVRGGFSEEQAFSVAHAVRKLSAEIRGEIDERLHAFPEDFVGKGLQALLDRVRHLAEEIDPRDLLAKSETAREGRHVHLFPAPNSMMKLSGMLPVEQGLLIEGVLSDLTDSTIAAGQSEGRSQDAIRADHLFEVITDTTTRAPAVEICLVMTDRSLFQGDPEPAYLQGYGCVPSPWARDLIRGNDNDLEAKRWIRRLYTAPGTGQLLSMDSVRRCYPRGLAQFIRIRDQLCATPGCNHPIRNYDHIYQAALGGKTTADNGAGRCFSCNQAKESPGFTERVVPGVRHSIEITTPAGKTYRSMSPPLPGTHYRN